MFVCRAQLATGLRVYFDKALWNYLLYDAEVESCEMVGKS